MNSSVQVDATTTALPPSSPPSSLSLSPTMTTFASLRFLQASEYPRKTGGHLFYPEEPVASPRRSTVAVIPSASAQDSTSSLPHRPLPTPPSSEPSSSSDTELSSPDNHLGSFPSLLAFFASERKIVKERDRERRRAAAGEKEARREARGRATLRYPKSHDLKIKDIWAREQRKRRRDEQEHREGEDGADEAADDEDTGPFGSNQISSSSTSASFSSRASPRSPLDTLPDVSRQDWPPSPARTSTTTTTPSPLSSSFTSVVSRRQRGAQKKITLSPSSVLTSPTTSTLQLPSAKQRILPFTLIDPSTLPPPSSVEPSPQLRSLADKLIERFPEDREGIEMQLNLEHSIANDEESMMKAPRDDASTSINKQVHVFVDHSNILVGLLQQPISPSPPHRQPHHLHPSHHNPFPPPHPLSTQHHILHSPPSPTAHFLLNPTTSSSRHPQLQTLSHPALALLLLRGREATTKALVASSPLHQPLSDLQVPARGPWDVAVLRRVKEMEMYEGMQNAESTGTSGSEAEGGGGVKGGSSNMRKRRSASATARRTASFVGAGGGFKEQAVDELLQLKILQTILRHDSPSLPPSSSSSPSSSSTQPTTSITNTLILASGDCAGSPLNPGGFRECVEVALARGWNVEVWGWRRGIGEGWREVARAWKGKWNAEGGERMVVRELDEWEGFLRGGEGW